jgi:hypothetical protein
VFRIASRNWRVHSSTSSLLMKFALVLLSVPAWITWPLAGTERRITVLEFVDRIVELTKALTKSG